MKSFLEDYGLIIVAVIVVLALCVFAKGTFAVSKSADGYHFNIF